MFLSGSLPNEPSPSSPSKRRVTYSPAYTLVPTYECFNRCDYCNFRREPGQDHWLSLASARQQLEALAQAGRAVRAQAVTEILLLSGEVHPRSDRRQAWLNRIIELCELALSLGFLPHTNAGPVSFAEMQQLKAVNVSLGLMVEQMSPKLMQTVHRHAPSKDPQARLQQLNWAGELGIPFTTGLLLGIGETMQDRIHSLATIAQVHQTWGHIQEVILQPHSPGGRQLFSGAACDSETFIETVALAREILPETITLQVPPNLIQTPAVLRACLAAGARDLGGIVPRDEVNPDYGHLSLDQLTQQLDRWGWQLVPRLPVYPRYIEGLNGPLRHRCQALQAAWSAPPLDREQRSADAAE